MRSRTTDWSPVGFEEDPTPGDEETVHRAAVALGDVAAWLRYQADAADRVLNTHLTAASWSGMAADIFTERVRAVVAAARSTAARHDEGAAAARTWSAWLVGTQAEADAALREAEQVLEDLASAEAAVAALGVDLTALRATLTLVEKAYASTEKPAPGRAAPSHGEVTAARRREQEAHEDLIKAQSRVEDAQQRLDDAKRKAQDAKHEYDAAEKTFANGLEATQHGALAAAPRPELKAFSSMVGKLATVAPSASTNSALMQTLTRLTPEELAALVAENPGIVQEFWKHPPSPDAVARWWAALGPADSPAKAALMEAAPGILGNLAGLPYAVRNSCNRAAYEEAVKNAGNLTPEQKKVLDALADVLARGSASLVCFNLDASVPMVAVGYGDLDTADTVTWAAPGMDSDAADGTTSWSGAARNLYDQQRLLDGRSHGVVGWLGYDTPDLASVNTPALAQDGAWRFATELDGTHAARGAAAGVPLPYVSVLAHSYGTTMAADALTHTKYAIDSFTMLGSAGIDTSVVGSLSDLHVKQTGGVPAVYTTAARMDLLAPFGSATAGRAEPNPEAIWSPGTLVAPGILVNPPKSMPGAQSFSSEGAVLPGGEVLEQTRGHSALGEDTGPNFLNGTAPEGNGYLDPKTEALYNAAWTTMGLPGKVVGGLRPTG